LGRYSELVATRTIASKFFTTSTKSQNLDKILPKNTSLHPFSLSLCTKKREFTHAKTLITAQLDIVKMLRRARFFSLLSLDFLKSEKKNLYEKLSEKKGIEERVGGDKIAMAFVKKYL
jgi:hypothetical protein